MQVRNSVTLIGNVGQLPTVRTLPSGNRVIEFSLATNDSYRNRDGEKVTRTEWHRVKAFGKVVDVLETYLTKGSQIALNGTLRYSKWTDKYEQSRTTAEIVLDEFTFLGAKDRGGNPGEEAFELEELMQVAEPTAEASTEKSAAAKTRKRRSVKQATAAQGVTPAEDLPF